MKKILGVFLSLALLATSSTSVLAADSNLIYEGQTAESTLECYVDSSYSVVIPEKIYIADGYTFTADFLNITENQQVNLRITNLNESNMLPMTNESGDTAYLSLNGLGTNNRVAQFTRDNLTSSITINGFIDPMSRAGVYTGTAVFEISLGLRE